MLNISAEQTARHLAFDALIPALRAGFARGAHAPDRHHHAVDGAPGATLLLMPAWSEGGYLGVKLVDVFPANSELGRPALSSAYVLADAATGEHLALVDGNELTRRRTVATSALAASYLARPDSEVHLVVGTGHIGSLAAAAHRSAVGTSQVLVYDRRPERAEALVAAVRTDGMEARAVTDLAAAAGEADLITCATLAEEPLIRGEWLRPGTHLDLIGSFRPSMREADDECVRRGTVFVDTPTALRESGDLLQPMASGALRAEDIAGTLPELCRGEVKGRRNAAEITVFKSVGGAVADLAAAALVYERVAAESAPSD
ncbi:ornithine cyclodeaminase family protein [Streptomyces varsoviensis]|uniref:Ornithine cyclodeaminase n=1 Tax=Streptomyces varsoviensis TaxID=67373 RepID=A0ABR5J024_9ACTN|nr:ornithine cyclodeaminase family protein [Streptomyces varsoviensis]KOG86761.1 ornithine cyclodeaminase [Streptomyces varsoviensis]